TSNTGAVRPAVVMTNGDGNGQIDFAYDTFADGQNQNDEVSNLFIMLQVAGLSNVTLSQTPWATTLVGYNSFFPPANAGTGSGIMAFWFNDSNYWYVGVTAGPATNCLNDAGVATTGCVTDSTFTPSEAFAIDSKIDDGNPTRGTVKAYWGVTSSAQLAPTSGVNVQNPGAALCANTSSTYNLAGSYATIPLCQLMIRMQ
nr:hypothetical protein [Pseudomonadota bacterium]